MKSKNIRLLKDSGCEDWKIFHMIPEAITEILPKYGPTPSIGENGISAYTKILSTLEIMDELLSKDSTECTCDSTSLFNYGCKCGYIKRT